MIIVIDQVLDPHGAVQETQFIDTTDPKVHTTFTAISGNAAAQVAAGYSIVHAVPGRPVGETRYQLVLFHLASAPANDPLKMLNPV